MAERLTSGETWPYTSAVIAIPEWPSSSEDDLQRDAVGEHEGGGAMPERVQADPLESGSLSGHPERPQRVARVARLAGLGGEHKPRVGPPVGCLEPLGRLPPPERLDHAERRRAKRNGPRRLRRLRSSDHQLAVDTCQRPPHPSDAVGEVDVGPAQRQSLTTAQPGIDQEHQKRQIPGILRGVEQRGDLAG
jgi:hypothetical protein